MSAGPYFEAVLAEKFYVTEDGAKGGKLVCCRPTDGDFPGAPSAQLKVTRVPAYLAHLVTARLRVIAAAPAAVRLALAVDAIRLELDNNTVLESERNDGAWLTEEQWQSLTQLADEVKAELEGGRS